VTNRNRNLQFACTLAIGVVLLLSPSRVGATDDENHIQEIMAGANGNSKIQFIVIKQEGSGNSWGPQSGETQSRVMLLFFDATGRETGKFKFPKSVNADTNPQLIATQDFANLPGAPQPDFIIPPLLNPISGKVCFTSNPLNSNTVLRNDCVSYGSFTGDTGTNSGGCTPNILAGPPAPALPIVNTQSLKRTSTAACGSVPNSDFVINAVPTPTNDALKSFTIPVATQVAQGNALFTSETFLGNGRSCGSCHIASESLRLPPSNIQSRFATLSTTFDPLFVAETKPSSFDAGFDFNLNTLVLTAISQPPLSLPGGSPDGTTIGVASNAPCIGELQGIITSAGGAKAKVLTQVSPTTYLVYGGMNPQLSGPVSDSNSCSGTISSITLTAAPLGANSIPGVLGLEDPKRMRTSADTVNFPQGRGLILENIDGLPPTPPVFRKSPHLLNLDQRTGPFGLSGCCVDLQSFTTRAVMQHFPRTLARNSGGSDPDFRLPTPDELNDIAAFLNAQEFPPGAGTAKFDLNQFVITDPQKRGQAAFFGPAKCSQCHGGPVLAQTTVSILGKLIGITATFNTGVVNQSINSADNLPCERSTVSVGACGSREFSVRQLFNVANLGPFFHDGSAATLRDAVLFYDSSAFNSSPAGVAIGGIFQVGPTMFDDIQAFLEGLSFSPFTPIFGPVGTVVTITGTNFTGATAVRFNGLAASFTVVSDTSITATVPAGATTGPITVITPNSGPLITTTRFTVTPAITSFTPASGPVGTVVTITGTNFTGATAVKFNGVPASFAVVSDTSITATVPTGATTDVIAVTTPDGTATSATSFTVVFLASTTTVTSSQNPSVSGLSVTLTAIVTATSPGAGTPTGMVFFVDTFGSGSGPIGSATLNSSGKATFTTSTLAAGSHSIIAAYGGDPNFLGSKSAAVTQTVNPPAGTRSTTTTVASSQNPSVSGLSLTFTATVASSASGAPSGFVTFFDNGAQIGSGNVSGGQATLTTSSLTAGSHPITAQYSGDASFAASTSASINETVGAAAFAPPPATPPTVTAGQSVTIALTMFQAAGSNLAFTMACSNLPAGATCTFNPNPFMPGPPPNGSQVQMIFATQAPTHTITAERPGIPGPGLLEIFSIAAALAGIAGVFAWGKGPRRRLACGTAAAVLMLAIVLVGCTGGGNNGGTTGSGGGSGGTPTGVANITVTATSGSTVVTNTIPVKVQ